MYSHVGMKRPILINTEAIAVIIHSGIANLRS